MIKRLGPLNYLVKVGNQIRKVHLDHLLSNGLSSGGLREETETEDWDSVPLDITLITDTNPSPEVESQNDSADNTTETRSSRYPQRDHRPVKRFELIEFCN